MITIERKIYLFVYFASSGSLMKALKMLLLYLHIRLFHTVLLSEIVTASFNIPCYIKSGNYYGKLNVGNGLVCNCLYTMSWFSRYSTGLGLYNHHSLV